MEKPGFDGSKARLFSWLNWDSLILGDYITQLDIGLYNNPFKGSP